MYAIAPTIIFLVALILLLIYSRPVLVQCKQLDLKNKSPIFQFYGETMSGLTHVKTFNRRRNFIEQFSQIINKSSKASISFDVVTRAFCFLCNIFSLIFMLVCMIIGINQSTP